MHAMQTAGEGKGEEFAVRLNLRAQRRVLPPCPHSPRKERARPRKCILPHSPTMGRLHTFVVTLRRESLETNWGLRLVGGADLATPLIVTRVTPGTPAGRELLRGDIIAKIDDYDARDLRHEDAQNLFKNARNQIKIVVQRDVDREAPRGATYSYPPRSPIPTQMAPSYRSPSPLPPTSPHVWQGKGPESLPRTPVQNNSFPTQHEGEYRTLMLSPSSVRTDETLDESIHSQPYRTTPLVLPGAKVRREPGPTESYLRHHPNPAMRAPPHHDYRDTVMKQKVVHKQFNSPINLYSEQNIANSIRQQTSPLPYNGHYGRPHVVKSHKPTLLYDPAKSETFRALQEEGLGDVVQEVPVPVQPKVFQAPPHKKPVPTPKPPKQPEAKPNGKQTTFVNSLHEEHIQQSNSFKRLMYNVLGDADF
ncbi:PDZ and LIM domain protein 3 isoform X7 [Plodia interpunctella]|uniref:PDZ and LIM domain protein 3 isoform X7 n=1 Tax=Plodia interpunctella TaxID=58824 RepID=UPI002367CA06|nr:PDZ and LIM domain protein 3 isoform X7 [Plodia interpunctella]